MNQRLSSLIHPYSTSEFVDHYESDTPLVVHDLKDSIRELSSLPFLGSLDALLAAWPHKIDAYLPGVADEANSIEITTREARERFDNGAGLLFSDVNRVAPLLEAWLESLTHELGLSALTHARSLAYAIPSGQGTAPHFDQNVNFVVQLHGTKQWMVAPNRHVQRPMSRHTMGLPVEPELASYAESVMPDEFPEGASEFVLKPGSFLFVPRGSWHKTLALTDAISLTFTFSAPTWLDLLTAAIRGRLAQSGEWRETANFGPDHGRADEAVEKFDGLLSELARDAPNWNAADIIEVTEVIP